MKERQVAITTRLALELEGLKASAPGDPNGLVFCILDNVKRSFTAARSKAGLKDLRFHDLRHTAATRLVGAHIPLSEVGRVLGHSQANTTYRYVNANIEAAKRAAAAGRVQCRNPADCGYAGTGTLRRRGGQLQRGAKIQAA